MAIGYTELDFVNGQVPALSAANLNHIDEGVKACADQLDAETTPGRAQLEAAAESQRQARFAEYDTAIMRLKRAECMGDPTATDSIAQWDEYAVALQVLNDSAGWFRDPQWPTKPEV